MGYCYGATVPNESNGTEKELPAWGIPRSLRRGIGKGYPSWSVRSIEGQQVLCSEGRRLINRRKAELVRQRVVAGRRQSGKDAQQPNGCRTGTMEERLHCP